MKKLASYLANFTAPSAGFSQGQIKDDPGDGSGSGAVEQTVNDLWYGFLSFAKKYLPSGDISDTDESETASDNLEAVEKAIGIQNENTAEYDNATTYAQDAHVMYLGLQFVSMVNSNTGNDPIDNPTKWLPCFDRNVAMLLQQKADDIKGGFEPLHNYRNAAYRQLFEWGKYNYGGDSVAGSGRNFQGTGVHLDGTVITGNPTLVALFDVGGGNEYPLLDIIAPDVVGTRTLIDSRGRVPRIVDAVAGDTEDVGAEQEDAMQRITGEGSPQSTLGFRRYDANVGSVTGAFKDGVGNFALALGTTGGTSRALGFDNSGSISPNTAKTDDAETRMKNFTVGVTSILVFQEI